MQGAGDAVADAFAHQAKLFRGTLYADLFLSRTPGPPPFSSMKWAPPKNRVNLNLQVACVSSRVNRFGSLGSRRPGQSRSIFNNKNNIIDRKLNHLRRKAGREWAKKEGKYNGHQPEQT